MLIKKFIELIKRLIFFTGSLGGRCFLPPLSEEEEAKCLALAKAGDKEARAKLIEHNMRLVAHIAKKYTGQYDTDDLLSVGSIGLIKAVDTYEPLRGTTLATYTAKCIENEILMLLRVSKKFKNDVSLNDPVGTDKDGNELNLLDLITGGGEEVITSVEKRVAGSELIKLLKDNLSEREFKILCLRYGLGGGQTYTQREVAVILGISRSYISRLEKKSITRLRKIVKSKDFYC